MVYSGLSKMNSLIIALVRCYGVIGVATADDPIQGLLRSEDSPQHGSPRRGSEAQVRFQNVAVLPSHTFNGSEDKNVVSRWLTDEEEPLTGFSSPSGSPSGEYWACSVLPFWANAQV